MTPDEVARVYLTDDRIDSEARDTLARAVAKAVMGDGHFPSLPLASRDAAYRDQDQRWEAAMVELGMLLADTEAWLKARGLDSEPVFGHTPA